MKIMIVAGGRDRPLSFVEKQYLEELVKEHAVTKVIAGDARGTDQDALDWARSRGLDTEMFEADWRRQGRPAGPIRNRKMAEYAQSEGEKERRGICTAYDYVVGPAALCVLFPGGQGTQSMHDEAYGAGLLIIDLR